MVVVVVRQVPAGVCMLCKTGLLVATITEGLIVIVIAVRTIQVTWL